MSNTSTNRPFRSSRPARSLATPDSRLIALIVALWGTATAFAVIWVLVVG